MLNLIEQNAILYYADFLSLQKESIPVTDNCKYYYIHGTPINSAYIVDRKPFYNKENVYYKQSVEEYAKIRDKFGEDGVISFVDNLCNLSALGCINANQILKCIHQYSDKVTRNNAFNKLNKWKNNQVYTHLTKDEDGNLHRVKCSRYVARVEQETEYKPEYNIKEYSNKRSVQTSIKKD